MAHLSDINSLLFLSVYIVLSSDNHLKRLTWLFHLWNAPKKNSGLLQLPVRWTLFVFVYLSLKNLKTLQKSLRSGEWIFLHF
jgi:hypothetical protein